MQVSDGFFVYVVGVRTPALAKIGVTRDVNDRMRQVRHGLPYPVDIVRFWEMPHKSMVLVERLAHYILRDVRMRGGWGG
jgi:hypothetical protein